MSGPDVICAWESEKETLRRFWAKPEELTEKGRAQWPQYLRKDGLPKEAIEALREIKKNWPHACRICGGDEVLARWDKLEEGE